MAHTLTETQTFDAPSGMTVPSDGDAETAASVAAVTAPTGFQALADRTQWLKAMIPATMWVGPRPYLATADGSSTSIIVGPTTALILNGFYLTGSGSATTISGLSGLTHGGWYCVYASAPATTIAAGSNNVALPTGTINVASTTGFPSSGTVWVATSNGVQLVTYAGLSGGNQFTGCTGGTGTMSTSGAVTGTTINYSTSTFAPEASLTYLNGNAAFRYVGSFRADHGGNVMQFRCMNGRYLYRAGGASANNTNSISGLTSSNTAASVSTAPTASGDGSTLVSPQSRHGIFLVRANTSVGSSQSISFAATTALVGSTNPITMNVRGNGVASFFSTAFDMDTDSTQNIAYVSTENTGAIGFTIDVLGYVEEWSP